MNSLRFGPLDDTKNGSRNRSILKGCVEGIGHYGNCFGVPTVGGEVVFDESYSLNPLVNAFALGIVRKDQIFFVKAEGIGNPILYKKKKTGRDGIHGATMASAARAGSLKSIGVGICVHRRWRAAAPYHCSPRPRIPIRAD